MVIRPSLCVLAALLGGPALVRAGDLPPEVATVRTCMAANLPQVQSTQTVALAAHDKEGAVSHVRATLWWRRGPDGRSKVRVLVREPEDLRGAGVLLLERDGGSDTLLYLPEVKRVRRITGRHVSGSLFGTDLTYEHLERLQGIAQDTSVTRQPDATVDGRKVSVLSSAPPRPEPAEAVATGAASVAAGGPPASPVVGDASEIDRVVTYVDQETCVPLKTELYRTGGELRWVMTADAARITKEGAGHVPRALRVEDRKRGTFTDVTIEQIDTVTPLSERQLSEAALVQDGR